MAFLRQKRNRALFFLLPLLLLPLPVSGGIVFYNPDIDISLAIFDYIGNDDSFPVVHPGFYLGAYLSMKSPFFTNYFNARRIHTIIETGLALNEIERENMENDLLFSIPLQFDLAYRVDLTKRLSFAPFLGTGLNLMYNEGFEVPLHINFVLQTGLELRYFLWKETWLKLKLDYGILFENRVERGYIQFIKIKMPLPFIP